MKLFVCFTLALVATSIEGRGIGTNVKNVVKNQFIDTTVPDMETTLNEEDLKLGRELYAMKEASRKTRATEEEPFDRAPMENEGMFEGDIANKGLNSKTIYRFMGQLDPNEPQNANNMRNAVKGTYARWPGAIIPYTISTQYSTSARGIIADAMNQFAIRSCIRIIPRTTQTDYIHIMPDDGCYSYVGRIGGRQNVSLDDDCIDRGIIMHELMHAVGFFHEQSRPDRDEYVEILYQNIRDGYADQFEKRSLSEVDYLGQPYDYYSIMHYGSKLFSKNDQDTIRPVASARAQGITLASRNDFSAIDIKELNLIAQCAGTGVVTNPPVPPVTGCVDLTADCTWYQQNGYCTDPNTQAFMIANCPRSCGRCTGTGTCVDTDTRCAVWQQTQFCSNAFYTLEFRRELCSKTCGFC